MYKGGSHERMPSGKKKACVTQAGHLGECEFVWELRKMGFC